MRKDAEKTEGSDLLVRLNKNYKTLSKGQKQLAAYITENYDRAAFITASKMGRIVGVSESTVVRFAYPRFAMDQFLLILLFLYRHGSYSGHR